MKCPYDGRLVEYVFGTDERRWKVSETSLAKAIRKFRVGALYPHQYSDAPIPVKKMDEDGYRGTRYLSSKPGAKVVVRHYDNTPVPGAEYRVGYGVEKVGWVEVARIDPEGPEAEDYTFQVLPQALQAQIAPPSADDQTALAVTDPGSVLLGLDRARRSEIETRLLDLEARKGDLEKMKRLLDIQVAELQAEVTKRLRQIWLIELYLGTHEEVHQLLQGEPAPATEKIVVHQRTLCMDEEIAVHHFLNDPEGVGEFDFRSLKDFDRWVSDPGHLAQILPERKGIVALRVRRKDKQYQDVFDQMSGDDLNRMTYLLIRNGENLYRIWADIQLWPRFFPRRTEYDWIVDQEQSRGYVTDGDKDKVAAQQRNYTAGVVALQGLLDRSTLLHPLPVLRVNVFDPRHVDTHLRLVRDDEGDLMLTDGSPLANLTWDRYKRWLTGQVRVGSKVLWVGEPEAAKMGDRVTPLEKRTGLGTVSKWPSRSRVYIVDRKETGRPGFGYDWSLLYNPEDTVWRRWEPSTTRARRVRFDAYEDEILAYDAMSWRVVRHLLLDRGQREEYSRYFKSLAFWYRAKKAEETEERPFIDLVLREAGINPQDPGVEGFQARARRLLRWWKVKTKEARSLKDDEAKALRMVLKAFRAGKDFDDDPEKALTANLLCRHENAVEVRRDKPWGLDKWGTIYLKCPDCQEDLRQKWKPEEEPPVNPLAQG